MGRSVFLETMIFSVFLIMPLIVMADDNVPAPAVLAQVETWFSQNVQPLASRKGLDPALMKAENGPSKIINVNGAGGGDFKTLTDAVKSIPEGNTARVVIKIAPGKYHERVRIPPTKPFVTLYGDPKNMPSFLGSGTAAQFGTLDSATVIVESDYFMAVNIVFVNTAPRPAMGQKGGQAVAFRIAGDKAAFYNCKFNGFQDTFCDDKGLHFFKDCYIEGTVDFIFGNAKSIFLNVETHVIPGDPVAFITAQARHTADEDTGYSFIHGKVTGTGKTAYLGRTWMPFGIVVFSYTDMSDAVHPEGWSDNKDAASQKTVLFGEFNCKGAGAALAGRVSYTKNLTEADAKPYLSLGYITASTWLLPPPKL